MRMDRNTPWETLAVLPVLIAFSISRIRFHLGTRRTCSNCGRSRPWYSGTTWLEQAASRRRCQALFPSFMLLNLVIRQELGSGLYAEIITDIPASDLYGQHRHGICDNPDNHPRGLECTTSIYTSGQASNDPSRLRASFVHFPQRRTFSSIFEHQTSNGNTL